MSSQTTTLRRLLEIILSLVIDKYLLSIAEVARDWRIISFVLDINRKENRVRDTPERRISSRTKESRDDAHGDIPLACRTCEYSRHEVPLPISLIRYVSRVAVRAFRALVKSLRCGHVKIWINIENVLHGWIPQARYAAQKELGKKSFASFVTSSSIKRRKRKIEASVISRDKQDVQVDKRPEGGMSNVV